MRADLSTEELRSAQEFIRSAEESVGPQRPLATVVSLLLIACGLVLAGYAVYLFTTTPTDRVALYVLLPGAVGGLALAALGLLIPRLCTQCEEKKRLGVILTKLLSQGDQAERD